MLPPCKLFLVLSLPVNAVNILVIYSKIDISSAIKESDQQFAMANLEIHT